jgi:uncharacterized protein YgiM (DUF1202 family)
LNLFTPITPSKAATISAVVNTTILNVYEKASSTSKKVGTLKKGTKVIVNTKLKSGWSEIGFKSKKAFVMTKSLTFTENKNTENKAKVSYLMNTQYDYVYIRVDNIPNTDKFNTYKFVGKKTGGDSKYSDCNIWNYNAGQVCEKETTTGYYVNGKLEIQSNPKVGETWEINIDATDVQFKYTYTVESVNETVTVPAGTFKNVIEIKKIDSLGNTDYFYFAPGIGLILTNDGTKDDSKLYQLKKK